MHSATKYYGVRLKSQANLKTEPEALPAKIWSLINQVLRVRRFRV